MKQLPNLFTLLNLVFGSIAIIFILQNGITINIDENGEQFIDIPEKIWIASLFIGLAAAIDFADGFLARLLRSESSMGKQLDSLSDLVSFGVAPGMILYQFLRLSYAGDKNGIDTPVILLLPSLLLPCAAAWRLAKFTLNKEQEFSFKGMPVPAVGIFIASLPLIYWNVNEQWVWDMLHNHWILYAIILLFSGLMVSSLPMISLKFRNFSLKDNWERYFLILIALLSVLLIKWLAAPVTILAYIFLSLLTGKKNSGKDQVPAEPK